jgi:hypothetical protein
MTYLYYYMGFCLSIVGLCLLTYVSQIVFDREKISLHTLRFLCLGSFIPVFNLFVAAGTIAVLLRLR